LAGQQAVLLRRSVWPLLHLGGDGPDFARACGSDDAMTPDWLSKPSAQRVCRLLEDAGHQAYFVGGCVRNTLLNVPVSDLDVSTNATPQHVMELAQASGLKVIPTGIDHGTVTVVLKGEPFEITTFRKDVQTDGRRAVVAFAETLEEDAQRRDFTMNALYMDASGNVSDPTGGMADLEARRFRFIGSAHDRIREDYLRILRFFRFHAWYGQDLDAEGFAACAELHDGLDKLSGERVTSEFIKLLSAPDPGPALGAMAQSGVLAQVLPGADLTLALPFIHVAPFVDPLARLVALGGDASALKLSNKSDKHRLALHEAMASTCSAAKLGFDLGGDAGRQALALRAALGGHGVDEQSLTHLDRGAVAKFPVRARDLPDHLEGVDIGATLKRLQAAWIASDLTATKPELLAQL